MPLSPTFYSSSLNTNPKIPYFILNFQFNSISTSKKASAAEQHINLPNFTIPKTLSPRLTQSIKTNEAAHITGVTLPRHAHAVGVSGTGGSGGPRGSSGPAGGGGRGGPVLQICPVTLCRIRAR